MVFTKIITDDMTLLPVGIGELCVLHHNISDVGIEGEAVLLHPRQPPPSPAYEGRLKGDLVSCSC